jgi:tRNA 2-thiouridine synthesizing protein A
VIELDCRGQRCPLPVIALAKTIRQVEVGQIVRVRADDPAAAGDIPAWCRMTGQEFVRGRENEYDVRRVS